MQSRSPNRRRSRLELLAETARRCSRWLSLRPLLFILLLACSSEDGNVDHDVAANEADIVDFGEGLLADETSRACAAETYASERLPVDVYFLVDTSGSMAEDVPGGQKWDLVSSALVDFLEQPASSEMGLGIGYFPADPPNSCNANGPGCFCIPFINICIATEGGSCSANDYALPAVPLMLPPSPTTLISDIARRDLLSGGTPTRPALEGAVDIVESWARQHPERRAAIVLATDGDPRGCDDNDASDVAEVAAQAANGPYGIRTFVLGVGRSLTRLNQIAAAGGTSQAFLTDTEGDLTGELGRALEEIRTGVACDFVLPERSVAGGGIDPTQVNVRLTPANAAEGILISRTSGGRQAGCDGAGGWYYDNPERPTNIRLCEASCRQAVDARIDVEYGCRTVIR